jgi:hypothetical protein
MSRKIARDALEKSVTGTWRKVARSPRQSETISCKEQERLSTPLGKQQNGRRMRYNSKISCGRDCGKAASLEEDSEIWKQV